MEKKGEKVKIMEERVQTIKENVAEDPEVLQLKFK